MPLGNRQVYLEQPGAGGAVGKAAGRGKAVGGGRGGGAVKCSKLSLIDLAGSERAAKTQNRGQRLVEGAMINRQANAQQT
jgi:hypothetical protein